MVRGRTSVFKAILLRTFRSPWFFRVSILVILLVDLVLAILQPSWMESWSREGQAVFLFGFFLGALLFAWLLHRLTQLYAERDSLTLKVEQAEYLVERAYQRLEAIFRVNQKYVDASDETEVIELVLRLSVDVAGASGASFVPLDEHRQPQAAISYGEMPVPVMEAWVEYLASPSVRERCGACENQALPMTACPLLTGPIPNATGIYCLPLRRAGREFGVLNMYLPGVEQLDADTQAFLKAMTDETALVLDGVRLRQRELSAIRQMQAVRQKADPRTLLMNFLQNVHHALESDFALLVVQRSHQNADPIYLTCGEVPVQTQTFLDGVLQSVIASGEPLMLGNVAGDPSSPPGVRSILAVPLISPTEPGDTNLHLAVGGMLVGHRRNAGFSQRQLSLLQTIAGQAALLVQNANILIELEYKTILQERTRLAREIHDGLAQTLGYLKLQAAQLRNYLIRGEIERARQALNLYYETLSGAYNDVRQTIDGLRINPDADDVQTWLSQITSDFQEITGISVGLNIEITSQIPPEVQIQIVRVVQEALSNVRKHAQSEQVWVDCHERNGDLCLEIRDDGTGFSPEDVITTSRYGLRGMRERANLIGADLQVISRPHEGTIVRLRLPFERLHEDGIA